MLTIEEKDYDLNYLIHFDMLREILIKLVKSQKNIQKDIDSIKKSNRERDYKIYKIEKDLKNEDDEDIYFPKNNFKYEVKEKIEKNSENNNDIKNNGENIDKIKNEKEENEEKDEFNKDEEINEKEENNIDKDINKNEEVKYLMKEENKNGFEDNKDNNSKVEKKLDSNKNNYIHFFTNEKNNKKLLNMVRELNKRVDLLENQFNNIIQKDFNNLKKELKDHDLENQSDFKLIDSKLNEIQEKLTDYDKKLEDIEVKCTNFDILNIIQDSGDGTVDAAKLLLKSLEQKCFKKFELIDARYKQESLDLLKMKQNVENFIPKLEKVNRDIDNIKEIEEKQKEEINNNRKEANDQNYKNLRFFEEKNDDILKKIIEIKEEIDKDINKKTKEIEEKIKLMSNLKEEDNGAASLFKLGLVGNNEINEEKIQALEKKINDVRKKMNDLENSFKIFLGEESEVIKNDIKDLKFKIDKKIQKEDLKELYNLHLSDLDEINDLKDRIEIINEEQKKILKDLQNSTARLESLNGNMILLQNSQLSGGRGPIIDFTKYIDQQRLTDTLKPIIKEIEKIYKELESFTREINDIEANEKLYEKKERVNKLEEEIYNKINELKLFCNRKYADKIDINKTIKSIEVQIKDLSGKKTDGDGWLMAKQPLKCFNCASCEANIKNSSPTTEYIPWNRYPQGERIYRMGQGFSHMLQMMTSEFVKTFDQNGDNNNINNTIFNFNSDGEVFQTNKSVKNINSPHTLLYHSNEKSFSGMKINNKEQIKDDVFNFYRPGGKVKLPKMKRFLRKNLGKEKFEESIPISDEEKDNIDDSDDKINLNTESPKIMKITRKKQNQIPFKKNRLYMKSGSVIDFVNKKMEKDINIPTNIKIKLTKNDN